MTDTTELYVREVRPTDSPALSRICLLTGDAGTSAEHLHTFGELIGLMYAEPYAHLPTTFGFVLVDPSAAHDAPCRASADSGEEGEGPDPTVVGYVLGTHDTRAFEAHARADWFPRVRARYAAPPAAHAGATDADARYIRLLYAPPAAPDAAVAVAPAHLHIDLLPAYQRRGWGRRLIARAVAHLRAAHGASALWLGIDVRNAGARAFYERLGFREVPGAPAGTLALAFEDFVG